MKKTFNEIYKAVLNCEDENGRKRCELFREVVDKRVSNFILFLYPDCVESYRDGA